MSPNRSKRSTRVSTCLMDIDIINTPSFFTSLYPFSGHKCILQFTYFMY